MPAPLHFYFDFISPYGYFASRHIEDIAARHGRDVEWHPMLLGLSVLKVMKLQPLLDVPLKGAYIRHDVLRTARRHAVSLRRDLDAPQGNPLAAARAMAWVRTTHPRMQAAVAHALYSAYWAEGRDLSEPAAVADVLAPVGIARDALASAMAHGEAAALLRQEVDASLAAGVFGSPTVIVDGELFWGNDRLDDVNAWLSMGGW